MSIFYNPETGQFVPIPDDAAGQLGFGAGADPASLGVVPAAAPAAPAPAPQPDPTPFQVDEGLGDAGTLAPPQVAPPPAPMPEVAMPPGAAATGGGYSVRYNPNAPPPAPDYQPYLQQYETAGQEGTRALGRAEGVMDANQQEAEGVRAEQAEYQGDAQAFREGLGRARESARIASEQRVRAAVDAVPQADPGRAFKNYSSFDKGLLILSSALNGFNVRFNGGKNNIADALTQVAEQDMAAQKVNIDTARDKVFREERAYDRQNQAWSQRTADYDLGVVQRLSAYDKHLASIDANTQSEINKANIAVQRSQIGQRIAELGMGMAQREDARAVDVWGKQFETRAANWRASLAAQPKGVNPAENLKNLFDGKQYGIKFKGNTVDGKGGQGHVIDLGDEKMSQQMNESAKKNVQVSGAIDEVLQLIGPGGRDLPGTSARERVRQRLDQIMAFYVETGGRSFTDADAKQVQVAMSDPDPMRIFRVMSTDTMKKGLLDYQRDLRGRTKREVDRFSSAFGEAEVNFPKGKAMIDPPAKRLTATQALKGLTTEVGRGDKADPAKIAGFLDSFTTLNKELVLSPGNLAPKQVADLIETTRLQALTLPQVRQDDQAVEVINQTADAALAALRGEPAQATPSEQPAVKWGTDPWQSSPENVGE